MRLINIEADENDYHYAGRGTMTTMPMWVFGELASGQRACEGGEGGRPRIRVMPASPLPHHNVKRLSKGSNRLIERFIQFGTLTPYRAEISRNPVTTGVCGRSKLIL